MLNYSLQEIMIITEFTVKKNDDIGTKLLESLISEFEDIAEFIENCHEAIQRTK
jgi:hypothetical protein